MRNGKMLIFMLGGILAIIVGIVMIVKGNALVKRCTVETQGTVIENVEQEDYDDENHTMRYTYYPVIEYKAGDKTVTKQSSTGTGEVKYKENDKITIMYNPDDAEEFIIKGDNSNNIIAIIFIAVGSVVTLVGAKKTFIG